MAKKFKMKAARAPRGKAATIDAYLKAVDPEKRAALERVRGIIQTAAPRAEECISYGVPAFRLDGKILLWFAAAKNHCPLSFAKTPSALQWHDFRSPDHTAIGGPGAPLTALLPASIRPRCSDELPRSWVGFDRSWLRDPIS